MTTTSLPAQGNTETTGQSGLSDVVIFVSGLTGLEDHPSLAYVALVQLTMSSDGLAQNKKGMEQSYPVPRVLAFTGSIYRGD